VVEGKEDHKRMNGRILNGMPGEDDGKEDL
jgi:hypothetical protein